MLGFTKAEKVPRHHFMAGVDIVLPQKGEQNEKAFAAMVKNLTLQERMCSYSKACAAIVKNLRLQ